MSDLHDAVGAYAVHALDDDERREFEQHLATCAACRLEVREMDEATRELAGALAVPPPPALKGSILSRLSQVQQLPADAPLTAPEPVPAPLQPEPRRARIDADDQGRPAPVDELALRRQRRLGRVLTGAVAAALVLALALGGWVYALNQQRQSQTASARQEQQLLAAPDAKIYTKRLSNGSQASLVVSKKQNRALFVSTDLASPGADRTYQLWTVSSVTPLKASPDNLVSRGGAQKSFFRGEIEGAAALAVSIEKAGGAKTPTVSQILWAQPLS